MLIPDYNIKIYSNTFMILKFLKHYYKYSQYYNWYLVWRKSPDFHEFDNQ